MNLFEIRKKFIQISGRYDLIEDTDDYADSGANWYINEGQRSLERRFGVGSVRAKIYQDLTVGQFIVKFKNCRAIKSVWLLKDKQRVQLEKIEETELKELNYTSPLSTQTPGTPVQYYPITFRRSPEDETGSGDSATLLQFIETESPYDPEYSGVVIYPPTNIAHGIEIDGLFYEVEMSDDDDKSFWSVNYSSLLIMSALRHLGIFYSGMKTEAGWDSVLNKEAVNIEKDLVEQEIADITKIEG